MTSALDREGILRSLLSLSLLACLTDPALSNTPVPVPPEVVDYVLRAGGPGSGIPDWNCLEVPFVQTSLVCITANDQSGDGERISELLASTKVVAEYLITAPGSIADAFASGTLWGMELRFMEEAPWTEPLSALVVVNLVDGDAQVLATVYCYDAQQYQDRKVQVMNEMGAQFSMYPVWPGCTLSGTSQSSTSLQVAGWENVVYGSVYSGSTLRLAGDTNRISGSLLYVGGLLISGTSHDYHFAQKVKTAVPPAPSGTAESYRGLAVQAGQFFSGDLSVHIGPDQAPMTEAGVPLQGVVYCEGVITVEDNAIVGSLTLVAEDAVEFLGNNCQLSAAADDLLVWVLKGDSSGLLSISGSANSLTGALFAAGKVEVTGSQNVFAGTACGSVVRLVGSNTLWNDGTHVP